MTTSVGGDGRTGDDDPAALASAVLAEEAKRQEEQAARSAVTILPDDLLPGVGAAQMTMRETLHAGGASMVVVLALITIAEQLERAAGGVLAPDIQDTLDISDTTLIGISAFGGVALVLGAVPLAWLADRVSRVRIVWIATLGWAAATALHGLVVNPFQLFNARVAVGFGQAYSVPVFASLLTDTYPIQGRARAYSLYWLAQPIGLLFGPFVAGALADAAGGTEGWRSAYLFLAIPPVLLGLVALVTLREPARGRYEQELVLGETLSAATARTELPVSMSTAYARMKKIKTFYYICTGIGVLGFALVAVPVQLGLLLEDTYGYGAFTRGWMLSLTSIASFVAIPVAGLVYDRLFRKDPVRVVRLAGAFIVGYGLLMLAAVRMKEPALLLVGVALASGCTSAAFVSVGPIVGAVAPYRMRTQAFALIPVFIFLMGGFFGGLIAGALSDAHGERTALTIVAPIAGTIGGLLFMYGSRYLKRDISLAVEELLEEQAEIQRMNAEPEAIPVLQVHNLDFSYGPVQVLFDVNFEVARGETVTLLGTNGAGKSTLLRAISGLGIPDRGVVRLNGRTLTYVDAELRFQQGIVQLRGGAGVFPDLSVGENLHTSLLTVKLGRGERQQRIARELDTFPALADRRSIPARDLSGGQQQMLALAMALVHEPEILLIDELSLGLAPLVVEELLGVVQSLKARGQTMIVVEQSLNVALAFADRALFMEKGRVRFEGSAHELAERDDLVRAVFLGGEGG
jgi:ABC-type branched-subunit amino acid transport system ATPase component/predicted MFS family arabinose efflux permease